MKHKIIIIGYVETLSERNLMILIFIVDLG